MDDQIKTVSPDVHSSWFSTMFFLSDDETRLSLDPFRFLP